jgi:ABC-2 type transport system permease protein
MMFASTALYPLWRMEDASPWLATLAGVNPFTYAVELVRFALYAKVDGVALGVVAMASGVFFTGAVCGYDPGRGLWGRWRGE